MARPCPLTRRWTLRRAPLLAALAVLAAAPALAAGAHLEVLYVPADSANAIRAAGLEGVLRQAPIADILDPRWPPARRIGKVSGVALSRMGSAAEMASALRRGWSAGDAGGRVGVDEITRGDWSPAAAARLRAALASLGPLAGRVILYVSPGVVEPVGDADPRRPLPVSVRGLMDAFVHGGAEIFLEVYRTTQLVPMPEARMALNLTRWVQRFPAAQRDRLHVLIGPSHGIGQQAVWDRVRGTPAGRLILANGPGAIRLDVAEARQWASAYLAFLAAPTASPPGGDTRVAEPGGLKLAVPARLPQGGRFTITVNRAGRAAVRMARPGFVRILARVIFARAGRKAVVVPANLRPGRYRVVVGFSGHRLEDSASAWVTVVRRRPGGR